MSSYWQIKCHNPKNFHQGNLMVSHVIVLAVYEDIYFIDYGFVNR